MDSIRSHKLRSFLTLLGVIIGVASVIMVGAAIDGLGVYAEQSTAKAFGSESFLVAQIAATGQHEPPRVFRQGQAQQAHPHVRRALSWRALNGDDVLYSPYRNHILRREARQPDLRGHHHHRRLRRHGEHSRYRRGGRPLLHRRRKTARAPSWR